MTNGWHYITIRLRRITRKRGVYRFRRRTAAVRVRRSMLRTKTASLWAKGSGPLHIAVEIPGTVMETPVVTPQGLDVVASGAAQIFGLRLSSDHGMLAEMVHNTSEGGRACQ